MEKEILKNGKERKKGTRKKVKRKNIRLTKVLFWNLTYFCRSTISALNFRYLKGWKRRYWRMERKEKKEREKRTRKSEKNKY
jgi:hypothetical protein